MRYLRYAERILFSLFAMALALQLFVIADYLRQILAVLREIASRLG